MTVRWSELEPNRIDRQTGLCGVGIQCTTLGLDFVFVSISDFSFPKPCDLSD